jgi:AraC-like DNA-binding protein
VINITYHEQSPETNLSQFVECFWLVKTSAAVNTGVPPDGCVDIVFSPDLGLRVVGTMTVEQCFSLNAGSQIIGIRFRPGMARTILGVPPGEFTDNFVQLEDLWPQRGKELKARLGEFESASHHIKTLRDAINPLDGAINPIQRAIQEISLAHGDVDLDHLASQANLSSRQFRHCCYEEAGLTPKLLCRILRFRRARQLAEALPELNWSKIAAETGYFDQAYLIRDFHEFTGRTPMSVLSNTPPITLS